MNSNLLSDRLRWAIERKKQLDPTIGKITQLAISKVAGVSPTAAGYWFSDTNGLKAEQARRVAAFLDVDPVWLESGIGDADQLPAISGARGVVVADEESPAICLIPKVRLRLQAGLTGFQTQVDNSEGGVLAVPRAWIEKRGYDVRQLLAIDVKGESMEPTFYAGDTVVVNTADKKPVDNGVYAINYEGESVVKRMSRDAGQWWLLSDNADQRKFYRRACSHGDCIVIGRVVRREGEHF